MDHNDRQAIESVFARLDQVSRQAAPRDPEAEAFIEQSIARTPGSSYYLAQTVVVQEQALQSAQARIDALEQQLHRQSAAQQGGFMSRLFGGGSAAPQAPRLQDPAPAARSSSIPAVGRGSPFAGRGPQPHAAQGGGFLAGAAQTAVGVAGGMILGNMIGSMFAGEAAAAPAAEEPPADGSLEEQGDFDAGFEDDGEW